MPVPPRLERSAVGTALPVPPSTGPGAPPRPESAGPGAPPRPESAGPVPAEHHAPDPEAFPPDDATVSPDEPWPAAATRPGSRLSRLRRPLGLRARATVAAALLALLATALVSLITYGLVRQYLLSQRDAYTARQAYANARVVRDVAAGPALDVGELLGSLRSDAGSFALIRSQGEWFGSNVGATVDDLPVSLREAIGRGESARQRFALHGSPHSAVAVALPPADTVYVEVFSLDPLRRNLAALAWSLLAGSAVTVAGGAALGYWASRQVLSPVSRVAGAAEALARGGLDTRLSPERDPDLQRLVQAFNDMADAIQTRIEREARFASDVSHELRTPLSALTAAAGVLERRRDELSPTGRQALDTVTRQLERFRTMVLDLLEISRIDAGMADLNLQPVALGWLTGKIVAASDLAEVRVDIDPERAKQLALLDRRRFERMVVNLLDNAVRYGASAVTVRLEAHGSSLAVHVDDNGPGIAVEERRLVLDRFTRGSTAGTTVGTGLGLALVLEHAKLHGGTVEVGNSPEGGARLTLSFPEVQP